MKIHKAKQLTTYEIKLSSSANISENDWLIHAPSSTAPRPTGESAAIPHEPIANPYHENQEPSSSDEAIDIFDLSAAVPPDPNPIVPIMRSLDSKVHAESSRFEAKCYHSGSDTTGGATSVNDEDAGSLDSFLDDDEPIMTQADIKKVAKFMKKFVGRRKTHR